MTTLFSSLRAKTQTFLFGRQAARDHALRQRLLIANLWVIFATVVISALLLLPFGENEAMELLAGFIPYALANVMSLHYAYRGKLQTSLLVYTVVTFLLHAFVIIILQQFPPHMLLGMVNFILLYGFVLGHRPALMITLLTILVGTLSIFIGNQYALWVKDAWAQVGFNPVMGWRTESISLFTTTLSTGFLVITSVEVQNQTRTRLSDTLTKLQQAQADLEMRHAWAQGLADLGAKLAVATTPEDVEAGVQTTLQAGLPADSFEWLESRPHELSSTAQFGSGPEARWLRFSAATPEDSRAFARTVGDLRDSALNRMNSEARLAAAARMEGVGRLAASVAHDFNNLLVPIRAANDFMSLKEDTAEPGFSALKASHAATTQARALIGKLLTHAGARERGRETILLNQLIRETEPLLRTFVTQDVSLTFQIPVQPIFARLDPVEVEQVLLNLVLNARDSISPNGSIKVLLTESYGNATLSVVDNGPGIPEDLRDWVLGAFHTTHSEGTGLGLSTVSRIARESGGNLEISSGPDGGAQLTMSVPAVEGPELTSPANSATISAEKDLCLRILIVDDDPVVADIMADLTQSLGHEVIVVSSGKAALEKLNSDPHISLVLTDYQMKELTGEQLLQRVRELPDNRPVAIITGYGSNLTLSGPHRPDAIIAKPIGLKELGRLYEQLAR